MKYNTEKILRIFKESLEENKQIQRKFELEYLKNKNSHLVLLRKAGYLNEEIDEIFKKSEQETSIENKNNAFNKKRYDNETTKKEAVEEYKKIVEKNIRKKVRK